MFQQQRFTGKPGVLQFMGVSHDWVTELNWKKSELAYNN